MLLGKEVPFDAAQREAKAFRSLRIYRECTQNGRNFVECPYGKPVVTCSSKSFAEEFAMNKDVREKIIKLRKLLLPMLVDFGPIELLDEITT
jgi:hypothetical protein